jgi:hypothetical protein
LKIELNQVVVLAPDYFLERMGNEITVYHPSLTTSLYLNETGALIWELCDGRRSIADIVDILTALYPESSSSIETDVTGIISRLVANDIALLREE